MGKRTVFAAMASSTGQKSLAGAGTSYLCVSPSYGTRGARVTDVHLNGGFRVPDIEPEISVVALP